MISIRASWIIINTGLDAVGMRVCVKKGLGAKVAFGNSADPPPTHCRVYKYKMYTPACGTRRQNLRPEGRKIKF